MQTEADPDVKERLLLLVLKVEEGDEINDSISYSKRAAQE
jgi:hypothetical protein